ncbi:MAG: cytochrome c [Planctomycetota bacterium]
MVFVVGCGPSPPPRFSANDVEWLKQEKMAFGENEVYSSKLKQEVADSMKALFGTPDHARIPFENIEQLVDLQNLKLSAGAVASDRNGTPQGLYREHCAQCHGVSGNGAGPNAAILAPYPRDFRLGKFKFKSTAQRQPPTDEDLRKILVHGIPGTAMPSFQLLPEEEIVALIDYVKYLSIRGQFERYLLSEAESLSGETFFANESERSELLKNNIPDEADPLTDDLGQRLSSAETGSQKLLQHFQAQFPGLLKEQFSEYVTDRWAQVNQQATQQLSPPVWLTQKSEPLFREKLQLGKQLFLGKGACYQCHGEDGSGMGTLVGYDDWTNDWMKSPGVNMNDEKVADAFVKAGAHRPVLARPRNLNQQVYRGGGRPSDLFLRITNGIEGSPMPAASSLSDEEVWSLVALVLEIPNSPQLLDGEGKQ